MHEVQPENNELVGVTGEARPLIGIYLSFQWQLAEDLSGYSPAAVSHFCRISSCSVRVANPGIVFGPKKFSTPTPMVLGKIVCGEQERARRIEFFPGDPAKRKPAGSIAGAGPPAAPGASLRAHGGNAFRLRALNFLRKPARERYYPIDTHKQPTFKPHRTYLRRDAAWASRPRLARRGR
jgi:hypothetical protein